MTKDTEALLDAAKVLRERGDRVKDGWHGFYVAGDASFDSKVADMLEALATLASAELGFDPTAEVGDEVFPHDSGLDQPDYKYVHYACGDGPIKSYIVSDKPNFEENGVAVTTIRSPAPTGGTYTLRKIVDGVDCGPVSQPYPGVDDLILAPEDTPASGSKPVVWLYTHPSGSRAYSSGKKDDWADDWTETPLYAHPPHPAPVDPVAGGEALREALAGVRAWIASLTVTDMNEIVADGGITAGMVVGQEATEQLRRLDAALKGPAA